MWWRMSCRRISGRLVHLLLIACAILVIAGCREDGAVRPAASSFDMSRGRELFTSWCAPCHGPEGRGDGAYVSASAPSVPPDLTSPEVGPRTRAGAVGERLRAKAPLGENHCPAWGDTFSADEIEALSRYVEELARHPVTG